MNATDLDCREAARQGDALADDTIHGIMGDRPLAEAMIRLSQATRLMAHWTSNASLCPDCWPTDGIDDEVLAALARFVRQGQALPLWADADLIEEAERVFMDHGPLSCTLLFCASLPACYQMIQLAEVLHLSGQLEQHTEHRIRQTAAMIFPVMMHGGLTRPDGGGVAQILKVRLIHATIRHLIVHRQAAEAHVLSDARHQVWCRHDWDRQRLGMPCSQLELAFTLLTFHFVFLRAMRTLGMGLSDSQERAYLHAWNVTGHVLGLDESLMAHDMASAQRLMDRLASAQGAPAGVSDPRPALGQALVAALARSIAVPGLRYLPVPMMERLLGVAAARQIGVGPQAGLPTRALFAVGMALVSGIDGIGRLFSSRFSLTRMFTRVIGYHLLTRLLLDQTRPLALPRQLLHRLQDTVHAWHADAHAPDWLNRLEDRMTTPGPWRALAAAKEPAP
jgi:hypothetical protein